MNTMRTRSGVMFPELIAALVGIGLIATLVTGAYVGVRQRQRIDVASAALEEAQNLCARWRAGGAVTAAGWTGEVRADGAGHEILVLRGHGLKLSTLRPTGGQP